MSKKTIGLGSNSKACTAGATLSREGARLLGELGQPGRYAILDPTDDGALILRCARDGISLGGGRFRTGGGRGAPPA